MAIEIGKFIESLTVSRDAVHVAIAPACAGDFLYPAEHVRLEHGLAQKCGLDQSIGIVDPFLPKVAYPGERFYIWMKPNTVTGLRHHWDHPALPDDSVAEDLEDGETDCSDC